MALNNDQQPQYELLLAKAIQSTGRLINCKPFALKDLFEEVEWKSIARGPRLQLGRLFKHEVQCGRVPGIEHCGQPDGSPNLYRKVS